jgi:hypothetical protein
LEIEIWSFFGLPAAGRDLEFVICDFAFLRYALCALRYATLWFLEGAKHFHKGLNTNL